MAGWQGFSQGLSSGMGLGMQMKNMQWQNEERKKIEQAKKDTEDALSNFFGSSYGQTIIGGGNLTANDKTAFFAGLQGVSAQTSSIMLGAYSAHQQGDKETYNRAMDRLKITLDWLNSGKFDTTNAIAALDAIAATLDNQDAINAINAGKAMIESRQQPIDTTKVTQATQIFGEKSKEAVTTFNEEYGEGWEVPAKDAPEIDKVLYKLNTILGNAAALGESAFNTQKNALAMKPEYKDLGIDFASLNRESYLPRAGGERTPPSMKEVLESKALLSGTDSPEDAMIGAQAYENDHGKGSLQRDLGIAMKDVAIFWGETQQYVLDGGLKSIQLLVNEQGFVDPNEHTKRNIFGPTETRTNKDWYQTLYDEYMDTWNKMESTGVDMMGIPKLYPPNKIASISASWFNTKTNKGDWRDKGWLWNWWEEEQKPELPTSAVIEDYSGSRK